jgi:hypothetical protein
MQQLRVHLAAYDCVPPKSPHKDPPRPLALAVTQSAVSPALWPPVSAWQGVDAWRAVRLKGRLLQAWHSVARRVSHLIAKVAMAGTWQGGGRVGEVEGAASAPAWGGSGAA